MNRSEVREGALGIFISSAFGMAFTGLLLFVQAISLFQHRKEVYSQKQRWRLSLFGAAFFAFIVLLFDGLLVWVNWIGREFSCASITHPHVLFYVLEKQCMNLFLYERAKIVHETLMYDFKYLSWFRNLLWLTLVLGVPVCFYWATFVAFTGVVSMEGDCVYYTIFPEVVIAFVVSDFFLASGMMAVFLLPLWVHSNQIRNLTRGVSSNVSYVENPINEKLDKVIRHNILCSSIALSSGLVSLTAFATTMWIAKLNGTSAADYLRVWGLFSIE